MIEIIWCPICRREIYRHDAAPIRSRASVPRSHEAAAVGLLADMALDAERAHREKVEAAERACTDHFLKRHQLRYRVWKRLRWNRIMTRRWLFGPMLAGESFKFPGTAA